MAYPCLIEIGKKYGRLIALKKVKNIGTHQAVLWKCVCGNKVIKKFSLVKTGNTRSCGCLLKEKIGKIRKTHGLTKTPIHNRWMGMKHRCKHSKHYSDAGIRVEWNCFEDFYRDMAASFNSHVKLHGENNTTLDRLDPNKNYSKNNCRWATKHQQATENTRHIRLITHNGVTMNIKEWHKKLDIPYSTLQARLKKWSIERALTQ